MLYDYKCTVCGHVQEEKHAITDNPVITCEVCGCVATRVISGGAGFLWQGEGFYINDYKKKDKNS